MYTHIYTDLRLFIPSSIQNHTARKSEYSTSNPNVRRHYFKRYITCYVETFIRIDLLEFVHFKPTWSCSIDLWWLCQFPDSSNLKAESNLPTQTFLHLNWFAYRRVFLTVEWLLRPFRLQTNFILWIMQKLPIWSPSNFLNKNFKFGFSGVEKTLMH